jgi:hypothetical protein
MDATNARQEPIPYWFRPRCPEGELPVLKEETFRTQDNAVAISLSITANALSYKMVSTRHEGVARSIPLDFVLGVTVLEKEPSSLQVSHYPIDQGATRTR